MAKTLRRWHVPPTPESPCGEPEGMMALREAPGAVAPALWGALRAAGLWARTPREERGGLGSAAAEQVRAAEVLAAPVGRDVQDALLTLVSLCGASPAGAEPCALAARLLGRWAQREGYPDTAHAFAVLAAQLLPGDTQCAVEAALSYRRRGEWSSAELWYLRAVGLGRAAGEWEWYLRARMGLGRIAAHRGNLPAAEHAFQRARWRAHRHRLRILEGMALHDLATVAQDRDDRERAIRLLVEAVHVYLPGPPPQNLLFDLGTICIDHGFAEAGLGVLEHAGPAPDPAVEVLRQGNLAVGASRTGQRRRARLARQAVAEAPDALSHSVLALHEAARSAVMDGEWDEAERLARRTLQLAERRREGRMVFKAEELLLAIGERARTAADTAPASATPQWLGEGLAVAELAVA